MAQNEPQGKGGRGRGGDRPPDPDTDPRSIHAPPPPETPLAAPAESDDDETDDPSEDPAGEPSDDTAAEGAAEEPSDDAAANGSADEPKEEKELRAKIEAARRSISTLEAQLAALHDKNQREKANDDIIEDYEKQVDSLNADQAELELFRTAEITFLEKMLPEQALKDVAKLDADLEDELDGLAAKVETARNALDNQRRLVAAAKSDEEEAARRLDRLVKPVEPIRAKLRDAQALRTAANKAEEEGDYARAYWLVMDDGQLQKRLSEDPIPKPDDLREDIADAREEQASKRAEIPGLEAPLAQLEQALRDAEEEESKARSSLTDRTLQRLAKLNPKPVEPA